MINFNSEPLAGQVAVVTGASSGIGKEIARRLAQAGARVALAARRTSLLLEVSEEIQAAGGEAVVVPTDVSLEDEVQSMVRKILSSYGQIDILVNSAGMGKFGPVVDFKTDDWDHVLAVNLRGTFLCCREVLPAMMERQTGCIINISSDSGLNGFAEGSAYSAAKAGVIAFTQALAEEMLPHSVRVYVICPGYVDTPWYPEGFGPPYREQMLQTSDIAHLALYLSSLPQRVQLDAVVVRPRGIR